jgi:hypothetical protein
VARSASWGNALDDLERDGDVERLGALAADRLDECLHDRSKPLAPDTAVRYILN